MYYFSGLPNLVSSHQNAFGGVRYTNHHHYSNDFPESKKTMFTKNSILNFLIRTYAYDYSKRTELKEHPGL